MQTSPSTGSFHIHTFSPLSSHSKTVHGYIRGPITNIKVICFSSFYLRTIPSLNDLHPLFPSSLWIIRGFLTISRVPVKIFSPSCTVVTAKRDQDKHFPTCFSKCTPKQGHAGCCSGAPWAQHPSSCPVTTARLTAELLHRSRFSGL